MIVYVIYYILLVLADIFCFGKRFIKLCKRQRDLTFIIIWAFFTLFVMIFKDYSVGSDTYNYIRIYNESLSNSILWNNEIGYILFNRIFKFLGIPFRGFWIAYSLLVVCLFAWFIYYHSKDMMTSVCAYMALGLFPMSMSGIRQMICIALFLVGLQLSIKIANKDERSSRIRFILLLVALFMIGRTIHASFFFLFPVLLLCLICRLPNTLYIAGIGLCLFLTVAGRSLVDFVVGLTPYAFYLKNDSQREILVIVRSFFIIVAFFIICRTSLFRKGNHGNQLVLFDGNKNEDNIIANLLLFNFLFICLSNIAVLFERFYYYTAISEIIIVSRLYFAFREKIFVRYIIIILFICSFFLTLDGTGVNIYPYKFGL